MLSARLKQDWTGGTNTVLASGDRDVPTQSHTPSNQILAPFTPIHSTERKAAQSQTGERAMKDRKKRGRFPPADTPQRECAVLDGPVRSNRFAAGTKTRDNGR